MFKWLRLLFLLFGLICFAVVVSCSKSQKENKILRYASITGLKAEKLEAYKKLHADVWPTVLSKLKDCKIQNYSIYLKEINGEYYLFSYFEYTGDNFEQDMKNMAADPETQKWWKETDPCQIPLADAQAKGEVWSAMEEVFHME